jgi:cytochrome c
VIHVKTIAICGAVALAASLGLARVHPFGDAGLFSPAAAEEPAMQHSSIPVEVQTILAAKCADCHSLETRAPGYARFAPLSWLLERDVVRGREAMNLAAWESYPAIERQIFAAKIVEQTRRHRMPLPQYRMIHWSTRITDANLRTLADWAHAIPEPQEGSTDPSGAQGGGARGKLLFEKRCTGCHALASNHEGPRLQGVYGRTSGTAPGFAYSAAVKKARIVWDENTLDKWLTDPDALIPGNEMDFLVSRPSERKDLISYLKRSSGR